jgi:hypothetical protein
MAAGLGYIEFATGDILTAAAVNGYLASQTVMVFASSAARASAITSPQEGMFSYLKDTNATEYYTGSAWAALGGGGGGGKVLQVVAATYSTQVTSNSSTYADTGLTATITPTLSTSKILVLLAQNGCLKLTNDTSLGLKLFRGATQIWNGAGGETGTTSRIDFGSIAANYLDSPATTSATTYKTQFNSGANNAETRVQYGSAMSTIVLLEIGI